MAVKMKLIVEGMVGKDYPIKHFKNEKTIEEFKKNSIKAIREKMNLSDSVEIVLNIRGMP